MPISVIYLFACASHLSPWSRSNTARAFLLFRGATPSSAKNNSKRSTAHICCAARAAASCWLNSGGCQTNTVFKGRRNAIRRLQDRTVTMASFFLSSEECLDKPTGLALSGLMSPIAPSILPLWCCVSTLTMTPRCLFTGL